MIRPFDLRDIPLIARLENSGTSLCNELALTHGLHPLRAALAGYLSLHTRGAHTCIACGETEAEGFAQMRLQKERGVMIHIAPSLSHASAAATWGNLLDSMAKKAGNLGLHQFIAEVPAEGVELDVLRQAGLVLYLRQDILCLASPELRPDLPGDLPSLRRAASVDTWAVQQLYYNTAPRLAQMAEVVPQVKESGPVQGYVLEEEREIMAYLEIRRGSLGAWFNIMIHPQAETCAQHVLANGLLLLGEDWNRPIYCCVRRYQEWLWEPLIALGFEPFTSSAVLVKRLVVPATEPSPARTAALEAHAQMASPITRAASGNE